MMTHAGDLILVAGRIDSTARHRRVISCINIVNAFARRVWHVTLLALPSHSVVARQDRARLAVSPLKSLR